MNLKNLFAVLRTTGLSVVYRQWEQAPALPYLVYYVSDSANFGADNAVYLETLNCTVELYSDKKHPETEALVENAFRAADLYYEKSESWIAEESLCLVAYTINI